MVVFLSWPVASRRGGEEAAMTGCGMRDVRSRFHPESGPRSPSVANRALRAPAISALVGEPQTIGRPCG